MAITLSQIRNIIKDKIQTEYLSLHEIKQILCEYIGAETLNNIDNAYIERKFIKYNFEYLLQYAKSIIAKSITEGNNIFNEIFEFLNSVDYTLETVPNIFKSSKHFELLNTFSANILNQRVTKRFLICLKQECAYYLETIAESTKYEIEFLEVITEFILENISNTDLLDRLYLNQFSKNICNFSFVLQRIVCIGNESDMKNDTFNTVHNVATQIVNNSTFVLEEKIRQKIVECLMPVRLVRKQLHGRNIIEVIGNCIVLSHIKDDIESRLNKSLNKENKSMNVGPNKKKSKLKFKVAAKFVRAASSLKIFDEQNEIHEVRIIGTRSVTIDCDFQNNNWHGKNIIVMTKNVVVTKDVVWDVSGLNSDQSFDNKADDSSSVNEPAENGKDGFAGESGGNVFFQADNIYNDYNFEILSNGGNGSNGQDGGKGYDGRDGEGISMKSFNEYFPHGSTCKVFVFSVNEIQRLQRRKQIIQRIKDISLAESLVEVNTNNGTYISGTTSKGQKIIFSRYTAWVSAYHEYLIFQGSSGQTGSKGGLGGFGGQGGYHGDVSVSENIAEFINIQTKNGKSGNDAVGGANGMTGKDGCDIAYTDYEYHVNATHYGENEDKKLDFKYYGTSTSNRVYCEKEKGYIEVTTRKIAPQTCAPLAACKSETENQERQQQANASRQKSISQTDVSKTYSRLLNSKDSIIENIKNLTEKVHQLSKNINIDTNHNIETKTAENIMRQVSYTKSTLNSNSNKVIFNLKNIPISNELYESTFNIDFILKSKTISNKILTNLEFFLKYNEQACNKLKILYNYFLEITKQNDGKYNSLVRKINDIFINKFRFNILSNVNDNLTPIEQTSTPVHDIIYLEQCERKEYDFLKHDLLGYLADFFLPNNQNVIENAFEYFKNCRKMDDEQKQMYNECIIQFIIGNYYLQVPTAEQKVIQIYRNEYLNHLKKKEEQLKNEWNRLRDKILLSLTEEEDKEKAENTVTITVSNNINVQENELTVIEQKIKKRKIIETYVEIPNITEIDTFKTHFESFKSDIDKIFNLKNTTYDWKKCIKDSKIIDSFQSLLNEKSTNFDVFTGFLAYNFKIGIKIYKSSSTNEYVLKKIFNPKCKTYFHVLELPNNSFNFMKSIDKLIELKRHKLSNHYRYGNILLDVFQYSDVDKLFNYQIYQKYTKMADIKELYEGRIIIAQNMLDENTCIGNIINICSNETQKDVKSKLTKFKSSSIGNNIILNVLNNRFIAEGVQLSLQALSILTIEIMTEALDSYPCINSFAWILSTKHQSLWLPCIIIKKICKFFEMKNNKIIDLEKCLCEIKNEAVIICFYHKFSENETIVKIEDIIFILEMLQKTWKHFNLNHYSHINITEWKYNLLILFWKHKITDTVGYKDEKLDTCVYYIGVLQNIFGFANLENFVQLFESHVTKYSSDEFLNILLNVYNGNYDIQYVNQCLEKSLDVSILHKNSNIIRSNLQILDIMSKNTNNSYEIKMQVKSVEKDIETINVLTNSFKFKIQNIDLSHLQLTDDELTGSLNFINNNIICDFSKHYFRNIIKILRSVYNEKIKNGNFNNELLALIDQAIYLSRNGARLRYTQKLAILCLLKNEKSTLAQLNTGEGKSLIVVSLAIIKSLQGEKVDIITCSKLLAQRDAESEPPKGYKDIYALFDINVSHNCSENIEDRIKAYSSNQIVYGDIGSFQRDFLLDRFFGKNIIGDRKFENIIVDEVDSMLLDKGNNMLYLSQEIAGLDKLEPVFLYIWQIVNNDISDNKNHIKEKVLTQIFNNLGKSDIYLLDTNFSTSDIENIWSQLCQNKIIDATGELQKDLLFIKNNKSILTGKFSKYNKRLLYLLTRKCNVENNIEVPKYLKNFILIHIESWIDSAITAVSMLEGNDYIVDVDRSSSCPDRNPIVTIVDNDTGTDVSNSQWENGLHQFLQLKHGCRISIISLKAVFVSNVRYFKLYSKMHGLSGTLGSKVERDFLQSVHKVDFVSIPTAKLKSYEEYAPILSSSQEEWKQRLFDEAITISIKKERAVLIICDTILSAENMHTYFKIECKNQLMSNVVKLYLYKRDYEEFEFAQGNTFLEKGSIIIATNLAGRGTDIKLSKDVVNNGGMHVCLSFLPGNDRVEQQAFGRAARCGEPGSGRLIIYKYQPEKLNKSTVIQMKLTRETEEIKHISTISSNYSKKIEIEEIFFKKFQKTYSNFREILDEAKYKTKNKKLYTICEIILKMILEEWAIWLDNIVSDNKNLSLSNKEKSDLFKLFICRLGSFYKFLCPLNNTEEMWCSMFTKKHFDDNEEAIESISNPLWFIKIGNILNKIGKNENADFLFNKAKRKEPKFCEAAAYYKGFLLLQDLDKCELQDETETTLNKHYNSAIQNLKIAYKLFKKRHNFCYQFASCIGEIEQRQSGRSAHIIKIEALKDQKIREASTYNLFLESIDTALGKSVTQNDISVDLINNYNAQKIYSAFIANKIISGFSFSPNAKEYLTNICHKHQIPDSIINKFITCKSKVNIDNFLQSLQLEIPNVDDFWELLLDIKFISHEETLLACNMKKLALADPAMSEKIKKQIEHNELIEVNVDFSDLKYLFSKTQFKLNLDKEFNFFLHNDILLTIGEKRFKSININEEDTFISFKRSILTDFESNDSLDDSNDTIDILEYNWSAAFGNLFLDSDYLINTQKVGEYNLTKYDSVTKDDFYLLNIDTESLEKIVALLINNNVLVECKNAKGIFKLGGYFNSLTNIISKIDSLYSETIINLLKFKFMYRIALEDIILQTMDNTRIEAYSIPVPPQLALNILYDLIGAGAIEPCKIQPSQFGNIGTVMEELYPKTYRGQEIINILKNYGINFQNKEPTSAIIELLNKKWLKRVKDIYITNITVTSNIEEDEALSSNYEISIENQNQLEFLKDEENTLKIIFKSLYDLSNKCLHQSLITNLSRFNPTILTKKRGGWKLDALLELKHEKFLDQDMALFTLNDLEYLISVDGAKMSWTELFSATAVIGIGIVQLGIACYTAVYCPNVSKICVSEGISDMLYGFQAVCSGKFSWKDYSSHKIISVATSIAVVGACSFLSAGTTMNLPSNTFDPNVANEAGKKLVEMTSAEIVKFAGMKKIGKEAFKMVSKHVLQSFKGVAISHMVNYISQNYLQPFCSWLSSQILKFLEYFDLGKSAVKENLKQMYTSFGFTKSLELFKRYVNEVFHGESIGDILSKYCSSILGTVEKVINDVDLKSDYGNIIKNVKYYLYYISKFRDAVNVILNLTTLTQSLTIYVERINKKIEIDLKSAPKFKVIISEAEIENLQATAQANLKETMQNKAHVYIQKHIIEPFLRLVLELLTSAAISYGHKKYVQMKEANERQTFKKIVEKKAEIANNDQISETEKDALAKSYNEKLTDLMKKTRNPEIFADIIGEGVPMDKTCVNCAVNVVANMPEFANKNVKFVVKTDEMQQEFSANNDSEDSVTIYLEVKDNHFKFGDGATNNDCLFEDIKTQLEENGIDIPYSSEEFRQKVANNIREDENIQQSIHFGWHDFAMSKGAIGGARRFETTTPEESKERIREIFTDEIDVSSSTFKRKKTFNEEGQPIVITEEFTADRKKYVYIKSDTTEIYDEVRSGMDLTGLNNVIYKIECVHIHDNAIENNQVEENVNNVNVPHSPTYVGKSENFSQRKSGHKSDYKAGLESENSNYLVAKHGKEHHNSGIFDEIFTFEVLLPGEKNTRGKEVLCQMRYDALKHVGGMSHK